jgi:hypothetical protein
MIAHGFTTAKYLRDITLPAVERGLQAGGKSREQFDICCPITVISGLDEEAFMRNKQLVKAQLAFYASTPAYVNVLAIHGWEDLHTEANKLSKQGEWQTMAELMTDDVLAEFALICEDYRDVPARLKRRYEGLVDSWQCTVELGDDDAQRALVAAVQSSASDL